MKKLVLSLFICSVSFSASNLYADTFVSAGVFSDVREYDQTDFPGQSRISRMMVYAEVAEDPPSDAVTVDSIPTGNGATLGWDSGNKLWARLYSDPPVGSDWQTTYTFHSGSSTFNLNISGCTIQELPIPNPTISADGCTISWNAVNGATYYSIYWYPLKNGLPDESGGPLVKIDTIYDTSLTLTNPTPGTYALRLNAHERCSEVTVNRSTIYKKHVIPDEITEIEVPSIVEETLSDYNVWDYYKFTVLDQSPITIFLFSTNFDAYLILLSDSGHKLAEDNNGHLDWGDNEADDDLGTNSQISGYFVPGTYIIKVGSNNLKSGGYILVVRDVGNNAIESICDKVDGRRFPAVFPGPNYPDFYFVYNELVNDWIADWVNIGDGCAGRCGLGCPDPLGPAPCGGYRYTRDCLDHDGCTDHFHKLAHQCNHIFDSCDDDCLHAVECAGTHYVDPLNLCLKAPCYISIQVAVDTAGSGSEIRIMRGTYREDITLTTSKSLTLQGGWDLSFTSQTPNTTFIKAPKATQGSLTLQMLTIKPE